MDKQERECPFKSPNRHILDNIVVFGVKYTHIVIECAPSLRDLLIHEAQQGCRDATYEPSRFPVAVPYPSPHRATPAYVVVTSSDLDTSRNKASVSGLSWISMLRDACGQRSHRTSCRREIAAPAFVHNRQPDRILLRKPELAGVRGRSDSVLGNSRAFHHPQNSSSRQVRVTVDLSQNPTSPLSPFRAALDLPTSISLPT